MTGKTFSRILVGLLLALAMAACASNQDPLRLIGVPQGDNPRPTPVRTPVIPTPTPEPKTVSVEDLGPKPETVQTRIGNLSVSTSRATVRDKIVVTFSANGGTGWLCGGEFQVPGGHSGVSINLYANPGYGSSMPVDAIELISHSPEQLPREGASVSAGGGVSWNAGPANPKPDNCTTNDRAGQGSPTGLLGDGQTFTAEFEIKKPINAWLVARVNTDNEQGGAYAQMPILVLSKNAEPAAVFVAEQTGGPFRYGFDGSGSYDLDGEVEKYRWDFGDGNTAEGVSAEHLFTAAGEYAVTLTVVDDLAAEGSKTSPLELSRLTSVEGRMTDASTFTVIIDLELHPASDREIDVKVDLTSGSEDEPMATIERTVGNDELGSLQGISNQVRVELDLEEEDVPRFVERIKTETTVVLRESLVTGTRFEPEEATADDEIPLPVVLTHGILGDAAYVAYGSFGPGMPDLARLLTQDGYSENAAYPTLKQLSYSSLHVEGIEYLASAYMQPAVNELIANTYADKVDIVAHSMGGLVSRTYLELLGGGRNVRKFVTLGTPHEGAAKAHGSLAGVEPSSEQKGLQEALLELRDRGVEAIQGAGGILLGTAAEWLPGLESTIVEWFLIQEPTAIGVTTSLQLLPDYPYYNEVTADGVTRGTGYPDDPGMDLQTGPMGLLGNNDFLHALNTGGFADGVEYFQIYRSNHETRLEVIRYQSDIGLWAYDWVMGPGDATVPTRSATLADYPELTAQLWKCNIPGTEHYLMMGHPATGEQVRNILREDAGVAIDGCNR